MMGAETPPAALSRVGFLVETEGSEHVAFSYVDRQTTAELPNIKDDSIPVKCFRLKELQNRGPTGAGDEETNIS